MVQYSLMESSSQSDEDLLLLWLCWYAHIRRTWVLLFWKDVIWLQQSSLIFTVNNTPCTPSVLMIVMAETFLTTKFTGITVCLGSHAYGKLKIFWSSEQSISVISVFWHFYNFELSECKGGGQIIKHLYNLMPCIGGAFVVLLHVVHNAAHLGLGNIVMFCTQFGTFHRSKNI